MKKLFIILSFISTVIIFTSCNSGKPEQIMDLAEQENAIAAAVEELKTGIINADRDLLESITSDKLVYGHSSGRVQNKDEFIEEVVSLQPNDYLKIDLSDQTITISGNTAIVRHIYSFDYISDGVPGSASIGNVLIWQEQEGKWKLLARQAYRL
jgi:hypothetical protein